MPNETPTTGAVTGIPAIECALMEVIPRRDGQWRWAIEFQTSDIEASGIAPTLDLALASLKSLIEKAIAP